MRELTNREIHRDIRTAVNELIRGRTNATGDVTLDPNVSETVLVDARLTDKSVLLLTPETASAAAELASGWMYVSDYSRGQCTIHHRNTSDTDRKFRYVILTGE